MAFRQGAAVETVVLEVEREKKGEERNRGDPGAV
jgi:hypothetical protein